MVIWLLLAACGGEEPQPIVPEVTPFEEASDEARLLTRASLGLRGRRPTAEELDGIEADPDRFESYLAEFVRDEAFGARVRDIYSLEFLTRMDQWNATANDFGLEDEARFATSVGEEPLRMLERIAVENLSYVELMTGDWTMANETLGAIYPLDYPEDGEGWLPVHWTDGRPKAGVLSTNALWWRYGTTQANANRGRANAVSRMFLCTDFLQATVEFDRDVNLLDEDAVLNAIKENEGCVSCHEPLEPMSAFFWGFYYRDTRYETTEYRPEYELLWNEYGGAEPAFYGEPGYTLADLAWSIAADSRYPMCAVSTLFSS